ncbi:hypothetical protein ACF0H5_002697 [Mactra antiquata]
MFSEVRNNMYTVIFILMTLVSVCWTKNEDVLLVARCRAVCIEKFNVLSDDQCERTGSCNECWATCFRLYREPDVWKVTCRKKQFCKEGCQAACKYRRSRTKSTDETWIFKETPAVEMDNKSRKAYLAWSRPILINSIPNSRTTPTFVYVLFYKAKTAKKDRFWQETRQTIQTEAIIDIDIDTISTVPEFWLMAVGKNGVKASVRFNASIPNSSLYVRGAIPVKSYFQQRDGASVIYSKNSTLNVTYETRLEDGYLYPTLKWTNPRGVRPYGKNIFEYSVNVFINNCDCEFVVEHFPTSVAVDASEKPEITIENAFFNAEYFIDIELLYDNYWKADLHINTLSCPNVEKTNPGKCLDDIKVEPPRVVEMMTTTTPKTSMVLERVLNESIPIKNDQLDTWNTVMSDWNITKIGMDYDLESQKVFLHLKWPIPFNHTRIQYKLVYTNIDHVHHLDAGWGDVHSMIAETTRETLKLRAFSFYNISVVALLSDNNGMIRELGKSRTLQVNTTITDDTPQITSARISSIDHEKEILSGIFIGVACVAIFIIFSIIGLVVYKKRLCCRDITMTKTTVAKSNSYKSNVGCKGDYSNQILIANDDWEIDCRQLKFASHIGQGAFGKVITGYYNDQRVAIKLVRDCAPLSYKEDLLAEINLMKRLGSHPNIVSIIGACTLVEPICLVMEYVPYGNLQNFLKKCRLEGELTIQAGRSPELNYSFVDEHGGINEGVVTPANLLSFARQVAMAMEYLAEKKYVHRDLAARNVLLGFDKVIKVCDFGLSRDIFHDNQYKKLTNGKLPLKWMAIESLRDRVFTTQSDVWSFGILLWEIVTMGASPYPNIALADLYYLLSNSYRMEKPSNCSDEIYIIMRQCWLETPNERPNFTDLRVQLELLLTRDRNYLELDNINVPLSTPESSSGSPASDDTKSLLAAQALQPPRKSSKDELTVNVSIHDKSVERLLKRKGEFDLHNVTIL